MRVEQLENLILFVSDLAAAKAFYVGALGLPVLFEDDIIVVAAGQSGRVVLHRSDRGHDERGIFPAGSGQILINGPRRLVERGRIRVGDPWSLTAITLADGTTLLALGASGSSR
jgi:catechol 2,3-dioxygenase-like lactoylglutathione lyase family enzyme